MRRRRSHGDDDLAVTHEINVTPFIDVTLVLLIIFMIAAPLATTNVPVQLPSSNAVPPPKPDKPVVVTLQADLDISLGNEPVASGALASALEQATAGNHEALIYVKADKTVDYGDLMALMNRLRNAGYLKVALVGRQIPSQQTPPKPTLPQ